MYGRSCDRSIGDVEWTGTRRRSRAITRGGDSNGTSLRGEITASYKRLVELLGEPQYKLNAKDGRKGGDGKVSTEWELTCDGRTFTLYDYKETTLYNGSDSGAPTPEEFREMPTYSWHIGGRGGIEPFLNLLETALKE